MRLYGHPVYILWNIKAKNALQSTSHNRAWGYLENMNLIYSLKIHIKRGFSYLRAESPQKYFLTTRFWSQETCPDQIPFFSCRFRLKFWPFWPLRPSCGPKAPKIVSYMFSKSGDLSGSERRWNFSCRFGRKCWPNRLRRPFSRNPKAPKNLFLRFGLDIKAKDRIKWRWNFPCT